MADDDVMPGGVPTYEGKNKYGEGAKDKLNDADHVSSDPDINVQGNDQIDNLGAETAIEGAKSSESNLTPNPNVPTAKPE